MLRSIVVLIILLFSREYYKSAFEFYNKKFTDDPGDLYALSLKAFSAAGLNDRINAIEWGQKAVSLCRNYSAKTDLMMNLAEIFVMVKEYDKALDLIEDLLSSPSNLSTGKLQLDPVWKSLNNNPSFRELIMKYSRKK